ncbi:MAG: MarR family winged helix-turn-helix transcriptional regulator [Solirubrobacteraceae bacterium]
MVDRPPRARSKRAASGELSDDDYERLAQLRHGLHSFLHWSAEQAKRAGLTATQHQLLLAVRASREERGPTVSDVAAVLLIRHHSAVELVDRAQDAGLITRKRDPDQQSMVRLRVTDRGAAKLRSLSESHLRELAQLAPTMRALWVAIGDSESAATGGASHR